MRKHEYTEALEFYMRAMKIQEHVLWDHPNMAASHVLGDHPDTVASLKNIAYVHAKKSE